METKIKNGISKEQFLKTAEIKVKNLLAELYEDESKALAEKKSTTEKYNRLIVDLDKKIDELQNKRDQLQSKFRRLTTDTSSWHDAKKDFETILNYVEGDKDTFIKNAEEAIKVLNDKLADFEKKIDESTGEAREKFVEMYHNMKVNRDDLAEKLDEVKKKADDSWKDVKHWFLEKARSFKEYITIN